MSLLPDHFINSASHKEIAKLFNDITNGMDKAAALHRMSVICADCPGDDAEQLRSHVYAHYRREADNVRAARTQG